MHADRKTAAVWLASLLALYTRRGRGYARQTGNDHCSSCNHGGATPQGGMAVSLEENETAGAGTGTAIQVVRPKGTAPMYIGWGCFIIAVISVLLAIGSQPESWEVGPYTTDTALASGVEKLARAWLYQMMLLLSSAFSSCSGASVTLSRRSVTYPEGWT